MSGIYIHIPFCKQACHYCDFHFSTSLKKKAVLVDALCFELELRKEELKGAVQTIYFGGGTPSLLTSEEFEQILATIYDHFKVSRAPEVTLEANPDDLSEEYLKILTHSKINRLSIGVQSFYDDDLKFMNRSHRAEEAMRGLVLAKKYFDNVSIDLIYGVPGMSLSEWKRNLERALEFEIPHLSCYALTVEPNTALSRFIEKGVVKALDDELAREHHQLLLQLTEEAGYENYEFSNFGKTGYHSKNNSAYWEGKPYLGIGPSAHSYDGDQRSWNVSNNAHYLKALQLSELPIEREQLSKKDKYNEYVMTRLRTKNGLKLSEVELNFGEEFKTYLQQVASQHLEAGRLELAGDRISVTKSAKFLSDGIAGDLFMINLK
ncbi:MAG: radical SAM family heme chaperone HemW [Bacteroidia bacterium]|nr:radical SAM family heme chaperone HemW [Bacteroidia bacterium]